mgnify:CR=1 FL=1
MDLTVYGPLRSATGEKTVHVDPQGDTVGDLIAAFIAAYPRTASQLTDDRGDIRPSVRVMVDGTKVSSDEPLDSEQSVKLFPAMRGG